MTRLNDEPLGESITLLLYGAAKSGKTELCGTLGDRTLYCDVENRLATLKSKGFKQRKGSFNPHLIKVSEGPIPSEGATALVKLTQGINHAIATFPDEFDTICVDGATAVRRFAMNMGLEVNSKTGKSKTVQIIENGKVYLVKPKAEISAIVEDFPYADINVNDYQTEMGMIDRFLIGMKEYCSEAKKHFVMTAHERVNYRKKANIGDESVVEKRYPGFTGQTFPDTIPGYFDLVWHTEVEGSGDRAVYRVRTEGNSAIIAGTCYSGLFQTVETGVNLLKVFERIKNG